MKWKAGVKGQSQVNIHKVLDEQDSNRIVILRALQLGDMLCAVPAFRALRSALPGAHITLVGLPWARELVQRYSHLLDDFIEFPGFPGFPEQPARIENLPSFLADIQQRKFDLALQMQGSGGISNPLIMLFGARSQAGFYLPGQYCPQADQFLVYPVNEHEVHRYLRLMEFFDVPLQGDSLEFPLFPEDRAESGCLMQDHHLQPGEFAVIHPGARAVDRRWPPEWFAVVADGLADDGLQVVLTGTREEAHLTAAVAKHMRHPAIDFAGKTSLGCLGALLTSARLLICNDTGVSHLAAARQVPSIVLFTASDPERWAPLDHQLHRVVAWATAATPQVVLDEALSLMAMERAYAS